MPTPRSGYMIPIYFYRDDIHNSLIRTSEITKTILLRASKAIKNTVEKCFKGGPVDQLSKVDYNKTFF